MRPEWHESESEEVYLRHLVFLNNTPISNIDHDYLFIKTIFTVCELSSHRTAADMIMLYKILHRVNNCEELS